MEAFRPGDRSPVPFRRRDKAEWCILRQWAVALAVEVHLPTQLAVQTRVLAGHVVHLIRQAGFDDDDSTASGGRRGRRRVEDGKDALALAGIGVGGPCEGAASGGGERVAEGGEQEEEKDKDSGKEGSGSEVEKRPLTRPRRAPARREAEMTHVEIAGQDPIFLLRSSGVGGYSEISLTLSLCLSGREWVW